MPATKIIWILLAIAAIATIAGIWQFSNTKGYRARGRRRDASPSDGRNQPKQRLADVRQLSSMERKLYKESQRLIAEGKVAPAARILEQLNMAREAIQCLEDQGFIDEAAKILIRMQRYNRAGVVYARHGMWDKAANCFKIANMPLEVAKASRQANNFAEAAEYFEKVGRLEDAANCLVDGGESLRAARMFIQLGNQQAAMAALCELPATHAEQLTSTEVDALVEFISRGKVDPRHAALLAARNKIPETILALCANGHTQAAAEIYSIAAADIGPQLLAEVNYHDRSAEELANLFLLRSQYAYAAVIFERMGQFEQAAIRFEQAEDYERAAYCYERLHNDAKVTEMKNKSSNTPGTRRNSKDDSPFALANLTSNQTQARTSNKDSSSEESTTVVKLSDQMAQPIRLAPAPEPPKMPPPPPPPPIPQLAPRSGNFSLSAMDEDSGERTISPSDLKTTLLPTQIPLDSEHSDTSMSSVTQKSESPQSQPSDDGKAAFQKAKFLTDLDAEQRSRMWDIGFSVEYEKGEVVLTYNDEPCGIYIITEGSLYVFRTQDGREQVVDTIGVGESFGELWLLADQPTTVRFVAASSTKVRVISREAFQDLMDKDGTIARKLYKKFTMRLLKRLLGPQNRNKNQAAS